MRETNLEIHVADGLLAIVGGRGGMAGKPFVSAEGRIVFVITSLASANCRRSSLCALGTLHPSSLGLGLLTAY